MGHISAKIVADSINKQGDRITTFELEFPRYILAELNTHRAFSRNSASSRAIPIKKMLRHISKNPFIPVAWQKDHKGMQGTEYITSPNEIFFLRKFWMENMEFQISKVKDLHNYTGVTKQICNRLLEPFMWHKVIITTTNLGLDNFFNLRLPRYQIEEGLEVSSRMLFLNQLTPENQEKYKNWTQLDWLKINKSDAEIHISLLAESMFNELHLSTPKQLAFNEYHIPYSGDINFIEITSGMSLEDKIKVSIGMCARVSYTPVGDGVS